MRMEDLFSSLPSSVLQHDFEHNGEFAWARDDALIVADWMIERGASIIGVDGWLASKRGPIIPSPWIYSSSEDSWKGSLDPKADAQDYITTFQWDPCDKDFKGRIPYFNLTVVV